MKLKMTTNKKRISGAWIPLTMLGVVMTACSIDIEETDSFLTKGGSDIFNGVENPGAQLTTIYNNIKSEAESQDNLYALTEVTTDELVVPTRGTDWGDNGVWRTLHVHTYGPTHSQILAVWNHKNSAVLRCTEIIDEKTTTETPEQLAQAKF